MRSTTAARRAVAGLVLAIGLPLATAGAAVAQSGPSSPSGPTTTATTACPTGGAGASGASGPSTTACATTTTSTSVQTVTATTRGAVGGTGTLSRTGGEWALPLAASGGAMAVVLGGRRFAARAATRS